ncbi:hypothetical protein BX616_010479 [Lobosporangium transversale]|uniref:Chitin-binding type-4 domain-containing protein n=1 Tax=Lobosporangium transversale TaxID=64571 RepID=A0A1Y2GT65_9FUNG|nr:hypothetical protein BCR41DRAFT_420458 [Lobosporangium transversale]KAF9911784.1 hypothetical protein BX616_010479 [Lobosporangium transversale]ORZ22680.1 hypothetical protein BCR41DRAFT_420458 [Lobosporangium transversale]|eukprot:XP_021883234.1 hypothetical protein BCR41DRAFT_420458 [Lobosporangium transversale]
MFIRTSIIASATLALLASVAQVEAHSWADCVDWRPKDPQNPGFRDSDGECFGWARQYPMDKTPFAALDSSSPSRHYQQDHIANPVPCSNRRAGVEPGADETRQDPISKAYGGKFGAQPRVKAGDTMCVRWPAKNHAAKNEREKFVRINMPLELLDKDPDQKTFSNSTIATIPFKNCHGVESNPDAAPCGGCFPIPANLQTGNYVVQWRWELNEGEFYASCWDLAVTGTDPTAPGGNQTAPLPPPTPLGRSTSVFGNLAKNI